MEYLEGGDLRSYMGENKKIRQRVIISIIYGILKGLQGLEKQGILQRDIKPSNIMLRKTVDICDDDIVIVDLGLAALISYNEPLFKRCGTLGYIAPEIVKISNAEDCYKVCTYRDVYSAGIIMYSLFTGKILFDKPEYDTKTIVEKTINRWLNILRKYLS